MDTKWGLNNHNPKVSWHVKDNIDHTFENGGPAKQQKDLYPVPGSCEISHRSPQKIVSV